MRPSVGCCTHALATYATKNRSGAEPPPRSHTHIFFFIWACTRLRVSMNFARATCKAATWSSRGVAGGTVSELLPETWNISAQQRAGQHDRTTTTTTMTSTTPGRILRCWRHRWQNVHHARMRRRRARMTINFHISKDAFTSTYSVLRQYA